MQGAYTDPISHQMAPFERTHTALEQQQIRQKENHKYSYIWRPVRPIGSFHDFAYYINNGWKEQEIIVTCIYVLQPSIPVFQRAVLKKATFVETEINYTEREAVLLRDEFILPKKSFSSIVCHVMHLAP